MPKPKPRGDWTDALFGLSVKKAPGKQGRQSETLKHHSGKHCPYCGDQMLVGKTHGASPSRDHVLPRSRGHSLKGNSIICCTGCNGAKGNRSLVEWLVTLLQSKKPIDAVRAKHVRRLIERRRRAGLKIDDRDDAGATTY